jgi:hypothetical protein
MISVVFITQYHLIRLTKKTHAYYGHHWRRIPSTANLIISYYLLIKIGIVFVVALLSQLKESLFNIISSLPFKK